MAANSKLETFLDNWLTGGRVTREAFMFEISELLKAERERCAMVVEGSVVGHKGYLECTMTPPELAAAIRELH